MSIKRINTPKANEIRKEIELFESEKRLSKLKTFEITTLFGAKKKKREDLEQLFDIKKYQPVTFQGNDFRGGITSAHMAKGKADMILRKESQGETAPPYPATFNDANDNPVALDTDTLQDLAVAIGEVYEAMFHKRAAMRKKIASFATFDEAMAYDVLSEWDSFKR